MIMAVAAPPPNRHRPQTKAEADLRMELRQLRRDALICVDAVEPRLRALVPVAYEISPAAHQLVVSALLCVRRLREQAS